MAGTSVAPSPASTNTPKAKPPGPRPAPPAPVRGPSSALSQAGPPVIRLPVPAPRVTTSAPMGGFESGGEPLSGEVKAPIETSLGVNLDSVRVHQGSRAQKATRGLSARAFAFARHIFLGRGERPTDLGLMAHEAAHVVQQQGAPTVQKLGPGQTDSLEEEAHRASSAVVQGQPFQVRERTSRPRVQRFGVGEVLDYFADKANIIPGFRMFTIVLGVNPINMSSVDRSAANILRAVVEFIPGGGLITQALDSYGIFEKAGKWVEQQIHTLGMVGSSIKKAVMDFIDSLSWKDIFHLGDVWDRAKRIFTDPIDKIISFVKGLVIGFLELIRDALLRPLAKLAEGTQGWDLLKAVLGKDPITGDPVPQTADVLIGGFMKLIGQEEIWNNIKKANALSRAWAWFKGALNGLLGFVKQVPSLIISTIKSIELMDIVLLPRVFIKVGKAFAGFLGQFFSWAGNTIWDLLKIIFEVVAPGAMPYLNKVGAALKKIFKNPIGFVRNLVQAGKLGFQNFANNIGAHLKAAFLDWLTGSLPGVYIPKSFALMEILKLALSVLGISWANIRQKLVKATSETVVKGLEIGFAIVKKLVTEGPAAAWEEIKSQLANLKDMVMQGIMDFIVETVVKKAVAKVLSLLVPGGAFIQAIISIYDTIMVFIAKLSKIIQVAMAFLDSMMAIANGAIGGAAAKVESTLAGLLSLAISFLAGFLGLGKIADKVMNIINTKVRAPVDKALDYLINWIVTTAKKLFKALFGSKDKDQTLQEALTAAQGAVSKFSGKKVGAIVLKPLLFAIKLRYRLQSLEAIPQGTRWAVRGTLNPTSTVSTDALTDEDEEVPSEQELMDILMGEVTPIVSGPQPGMTVKVPGKEGKVKTVPATPATTISVSSLGLSEEILYFYIDTSPASQARKASVSQGVQEKIALAQTSQDSHEIYKALQQAGGMVNSLYPKNKPVAVVHHEQQVHEYPETFAKTQEERVAIPKPVERQMKDSVAKIRSKYKAMKRLSKQEKSERAKKDIKELVSLIKKSLLDWKLTRERDEKGKRTSEGSQATAGPTPLDEIDLIAGSKRGHITIHRQPK